MPTTEVPANTVPRRTAAELQDIANDFHRDGYAIVPGVLDAAWVDALRHRTDALIDDPDLAARENPDRHDRHYVQKHGETPFILRNTIELDPLFVHTLELDTIVDLAEAIVGPDCRFCGHNVLRNTAGVAIETWHVDDTLFFPLPDDVERHDPRIRMPVPWLTVQIALSNIDAPEHGPTQYVPGSHYSGRRPPADGTPQFEGRDPVSIFCRAGDAYLHNSQCWHRGAPVTSDRPRYLMQCQYAVDWAFRRFGWMNRVPVADEVLADASDRLLTILGRRRPDPEGVATS